MHLLAGLDAILDFSFCCRELQEEVAKMHKRAVCEVNGETQHSQKKGHLQSFGLRRTFLQSLEQRSAPNNTFTVIWVDNDFGDKIAE